MMSARRRQAKGVSLIELMVALAIGSLLVLGLVQVFAGSRTAYQLSSGLARTQENGRFAIDILQRDLRMAGHLGCVNDQARFLPSNVTSSRPALLSTFLSMDEQFGTGAAPVTNYGGASDPLRFDRGIEAFNAVDTGSGDTLTLTATPTLATAATNWQPQLPNRLYTDLTAGTVGRPVAGSDIVVLRYLMPTGAQVTAFTAGSTTNIEVANLAPLLEGDTNPGLFGISDCLQAGVFSATSRTGTAMTVQTSGLNRSTFDTVPQFTLGQSMVYRAESIAYYIGLNGSGNPALYRLRYWAAPGAATLSTTKEELVEGIESMQLQFGQDSNTTTAGRPTGNIGTSVAANALQPAGAANYDHAWRRVGLVQVGLVARSPDPAAATQRTDVGVPRLSALGVIIAPPNDTHYRAVYEDTVALRNRLFGN